MKNTSYLTAPVVVLALLVSGCSQEAPTAASGNESAQKLDAPAVSSEELVGPQLTPEVPVNPTGNCCPRLFFIVLAAPGDPADFNGDGAVCIKGTSGGTITIDNNNPGVCAPCPDGTVPPCEL